MKMTVLERKLPLSRLPQNCTINSVLHVLLHVLDSIKDLIELLFL